MKTTKTCVYTHIVVTPKPGSLEEVMDPGSEYNRTVREETHLALAAPFMRDLLERAAQRLKEYCSDANGDLNDLLAREIEVALAIIGGTK